MPPSEEVRRGREETVREHAQLLGEHEYVIQEIVGRHLYGFIPSPELVPPR